MPKLRGVSREEGSGVSRAWLSIHKGVVVALIAISVPPRCGCASLLAQESTPHWVPFVARFVEEVNEPVPSLVTVRVKTEGVYVRDSQGVSYTRRVSSTRSALPLRGAVDIAILHDRPNHTSYVIDFAKKTIQQRMDPSGNPDFAVEPLSRADFERRHAADLFLGKQVVSGVECEGYKIADPRHKGKYKGEGWFAPSLNFMMVRYHGRLPDGGEISTLLQDIEPGKEPDPSFFRLPEGFKRVK